jgi:hypothetical protein
MSKKDEALLELVKQYDRVRTEHTVLTKTKDELSTQIKGIIGDRTDVPVDGYRVSYRADPDKEVEKVDLVKFQKEQPKLYKKYVTVETKVGSRRLVIGAIEA